MSKFTFDANLFSDLYKDAYGTRPHYHRFYAEDTTDEERQQFWDWAIRDAEIAMEEDARREAEAVASFESAIANTMEMANCDRATAIRYQIEAVDMIDEYDPGYIVYNFGLPYFKGYEEEFVPHLSTHSEEVQTSQLPDHAWDYLEVAQ